MGLFLENGPYRIQDTPQGELVENQYSWNDQAHLMYWDQPIGTGYSNIKEENSEITFVENENELSDIFYLALQDFFTKHPEYRSCPLYIAGESYAGKYVPNIAMKIHSNNADSLNKINLSGIAIGDGWINAELQMKNYIQYAYTLGYLDTFQNDLLMSDYVLFCTALKIKDWPKAYDISNNIVSNVAAMGGGFDVYDIRSFSGIPMSKVKTYMDLDSVKEALHVPKDQEWNCADNDGPVAKNLIPDNMQDSSQIYSEFIKLDNYKVLMYTGTFDTACGSLSTENILYDLEKWGPESDENWRKIKRNIWAQPSGNTKGFIKQYKNLSQIVLPNSGHQVPYYLPEISLEMITKWIHNQEFPQYLPTRIDANEKV